LERGEAQREIDRAANLERPLRVAEGAKAATSTFWAGLKLGRRGG